MGVSDDVIDTLIAEAGGNIKGLHAVSAVIANRAAQSGLTPDQVVKQPHQFEGYSNPGRSSREAQKSPHIRALAEKAYNDIVSGAVPDPTNGGTQFRAASASGVLGKNVVNIGGNVFKLGNSPSSAVAAIDAVAPVPRSIPTSLSAYADTPAVALPPLPVPRPNPPQSVPLSLTDALRSKYTSVAPSADAASSYGGILPPALQQPAPGLTSRPVQSIRIAPGDPLMGYAPPSLQDALNAKAAQMAQQRPVVPSLHVANGSAGVGASRNALIPSFVPQQNSGAIKTIGQAAQVALPPNVVPSSVLRDLQTIAPRAVNSSGSPDDRQTAPVIKPASLPQIPAPIPMPSRPSALSANPLVQRNSNDVVRSVPYVPPTPSPSHYTDASNPLYIDRLGLTVGPPVAPAVQAIQQAAPTTKQVLNPAYAKWVANPVAISKLQDIHDFRDDAAMASQGSAARLPAPPKYIRVPVPGSSPQVPLPRPRPQLLPVQQPQATGGLLGLLFPGTNPAALSMIGQGFGGAPSAPLPAPGNSFLAARDVPTAGLNVSQMANELNKQMASSSRNADGSRGFGVA
jgi:hypothetical protein